MKIFFIWLSFLITINAWSQVLFSMIGSEGILTNQALIASVESEEAAYYNPAGLAGISKTISSGATVWGMNENHGLDKREFFSNPAYLAQVIPLDGAGTIAFFLAMDQDIRFGFSERSNQQHMKLNMKRTSNVFGSAYGIEYKNIKIGFNLMLSHLQTKVQIYSKKFQYSADDFNKNKKEQYILSQETSSWLADFGLGIQGEFNDKNFWGIYIKPGGYFLKGEGSSDFSSSMITFKNNDQITISESESFGEVTDIQKNPLEIRIGYRYLLTEKSSLELGLNYKDISPTETRSKTKSEWFIYDEEYSMQLKGTSRGKDTDRDHSEVFKRVSLAYTHTFQSIDLYSSVGTLIVGDDKAQDQDIYLAALGFAKTINQNYRTHLGLHYTRMKPHKKDPSNDFSNKEFNDMEIFSVVVGGAYYF